MAARSRRGRTAVALSLGVALCGCAPDLRLGPSSGTDGGGASGAGGSTTTSSSAAGSGGTSMSGGGSGGVDNGGVPIWATSLAGDGDETPRAIVQNSAGEILVAAEMTGSLDVSNLVSAGSTDVALVRFSGIGKAIALRLAEEGVKVIVSSRDRKNIQDTVDEIKGKGFEAHGIVCHVGKAEDRSRLIN